MIWVSYPPDKADLSEFKIPVTLMYGSRETRFTDGSVAECKDLLPADTAYVRIEGGDHQQFTSYEIDPEDAAQLSIEIPNSSRSSRQN